MVVSKTAGIFSTIAAAYFRNGWFNHLGWKAPSFLANFIAGWLGIPPNCWWLDQGKIYLPTKWSEIFRFRKVSGNFGKHLCFVDFVPPQVTVCSDSLRQWRCLRQWQVCWYQRIINLPRRHRNVSERVGMVSMACSSRSFAEFCGSILISDRNVTKVLLEVWMNRRCFVICRVDEFHYLILFK